MSQRDPRPPREEMERIPRIEDASRWQSPEHQEELRRHLIYVEELRNEQRDAMMQEQEAYQEWLHEGMLEEEEHRYACTCPFIHFGPCLE